MSHGGKDFSVITFCSVNCQLAYSWKERVPDSLLLLFFIFGCFRVWHQEISSSSFLRISKEITSSHHPNAHMIQIRRILGMKTSETPEKKFNYYYIKSFHWSWYLTTLFLLSFFQSFFCQSLTQMMAWSNQPTGVWAFPVTDGWTAERNEGRKKEEYLSHTPPKLHQKLIQSYTLSYSAGQGWWWWWGGWPVISRSELKKTGN